MAISSRTAGGSPPPIMPFPSASIRQKISSQDWSICVQGWELLTRAYLDLPQEMFELILSDDKSSLNRFLVSYLGELGTKDSDPLLSVASRNKALQKQVFLLIHRGFTTVKQPARLLLHWTLWGDVSRVLRHSPSIERLLESAWSKFGAQLETSLAMYKADLLKQLETGKVSSDSHDPLSQRLLPLLRACPSAGRSFLSGTDLVDTISSAYVAAETTTKSRLLLLVYLGLNAYMLSSKPHNASLLDQLYNMTSGVAASQQGLLADLVTDTPIIARLKSHFTVGGQSTRATSVVSGLEKHRRPHSSRPRRAPRKAVDKGKNKASDEYGHHAIGEVHVHRMSLITQVQDLFPDLGSGFIHKLLEEYHDDAEQVTAHLLDDSLPAHLQSADRSEPLPKPQQPSADLAPHLAPRTTPPASPLPTRRNIYDSDDDLSNLTLGTSRLHIGRRDAKATADALLASTTPTDRTTSKAAILSALAAFDADDDEHDDTYDLEDVGGTVDTSRPGGLAEEGDNNINDMRDKNEEILYHAFSANPEIFERSSATRMSQPRRALKSETGMTDEAIEGWAVMLKRDPRSLRRLELKYNTFGGQQAEIGRTAWRAGEETEDSEASGAEGGRGGFRGRGPRARGGGRGGVGRGGRGGNVAGPADEKGTEVARQRKEANKGARANHNRRDGRARKVARAGFPG